MADFITRRPPAATVTGVKLTSRVMSFDPRRSLEELDIHPRPIQQSLADTIAWFRQIGWLPDRNASTR